MTRLCVSAAIVCGNCYFRISSDFVWEVDVCLITARTISNMQDAYLFLAILLAHNLLPRLVCLECVYASNMAALSCDG